MSRTIAESLSSRDNALNFIRLLLAVTVLFHHGWAIGGFEAGHIFDASGWAVNGFFAISGYLIAGSRMRLGSREYLLHRVLRIFPAYWVILLATAFILSPLAALISGETWESASAASYVVGNFALWNFQWGIDETLSQVPLATLWNGSLWTLFFEFSAYIAAALLLVTPWLRRNALVIVTLVLAGLLLGQILAHGPLDVTTNLYLNSLRLGSFFVAGMWLFFMGERLTTSYRNLGIAVVLFVILIATGMAEWLGQLPFAFILLWVAARLKIRMGARNDISYGIYIWAFPIQQLIIVAGLDLLGPYGTFVLALALTSGVAWLSWRYVEQPAMRFRHRISPRILGRVDRVQADERAPTPGRH